MNSPVQRPDAARFEELVSSCGLTGLLQDYHYISGLLLAIASAPDLIEPAEWLPLVFVEEHETEPASVEVLQQLLDELVVIWNHWAGLLDTEDSELVFPRAYSVVAGAPSPALSGFCMGVTQGYDWLQQVWDDFFDMMDGAEDLEEMENIFGGTLAAAMVLIDPAAAREIMAADGIEPMEPEEALDLLGEGLFIVGKLGRIAANDEFDDEFDGEETLQ